MFFQGGVMVSKIERTKQKSTKETRPNQNRVKKALVVQSRTGQLEYDLNPLIHGQ